MTTPQAAAARNDAITRLIKEHREDFDRIHHEEATKRGITPRPRKPKPPKPN